MLIQQPDISLQRVYERLKKVEMTSKELMADLASLQIQKTQLPATVAYEDEANTFTQNQRIDAGLGVNVAPGATGTISASDAIFERGRSVAMGEWQSYTPSWTNLTIGDATVVARYALIGKTCHVAVSATVGSTTSFTASGVSMSVPFTIGFGHPLTGSAVYLDAGVAFYGGNTIINSSTTVALLSDTSGAIGGITSTVPFAWGTGDRIFVTLTYEIA